MKTVTDALRQRPVASFFVLTYVYSWILWAPMLAIPGEVAPGESDTIIWLGVGLMYLGGFGPLVAAAFVVKFGGGNIRKWAAQITKWRVDRRWWLVTLGLPLVAIAIISALYIALGGAYDLGNTEALMFYVPLLLFAAIFSGGLNEEPGWRGLAIPILQERYSALGASLIVGVVWAFWHLPLFFAPVAPHSGMPLLGTLLYFPTVVLWSILLSWVYNGSASVLLAMLLHAGLNSANGLIPLDPEAVIVDGVMQTALIDLVWILTAVVYLTIVLGVLAVYGRGLSRRGGSSGQDDHSRQEVPTGEVAGL